MMPEATAASSRLSAFATPAPEGPSDRNEARAGSVEHWAQQRPDSIAIVEGEKVLTWADWNKRADRLASSLTRLGLRGGDIIAIRSQVRIEWCLATAAAAKLGCTLLCLNWRLTPVETAYILNHSAARAVICDDQEPEVLRAAWVNRPDTLAISVTRPTDGFHVFDDLLAAEGDHYVSAGPAKLMIYTSGTTGLPKGVIPDQPAAGAVVQLQEYMDDVMRRGMQQPGDVVLVTLPLHHGAGAGLIHQAIEYGNSLILLPRYDSEAALAAIEKHRVTFWFAVPTMLKRMAALSPAVFERYDLRSIRSLLTGAAPVPFELKRWIVAAFGPCLTEAYGSTETSMITALAPEDQLTRPGCSGRPYRHVAVKILDPDGRSVGPDTIGEIWARTPAVIQAYVGSPPLGPDTKDADGFFKVGDAGYQDADGYLYITDRIKDMIISGGVNIYPAEIETVLLEHPGVLDVAVIGVPNEEFGEEVVGFFEARAGAPPSEAELLAFCAASLASYKRPRSLKHVKELPRNSMGKVMKRELREPYWAGRERKV